MMIQEALMEEKGTLPHPFADPLEIAVHEDVDRAIKELKKRVNREGILKDLKLRRFYEKPSERKKRKLKEAEKRRRKLLRRKNRRQHLLERRLRSL
jgi:small subunit ribosomal protein S21